MSEHPGWLTALAGAARDLDARTLSRELPPPPASARKSAVLMLVAAGSRGPELVLIERAHDMRSHAGQVAFPGGAADPDDDGPAATALREAQEEIGLDPDGVEVVAVLPALWLPPSNFAVTPVLAWWRSESPIGAVDAAEVASVLRVPMCDLVDPARRFTVRHPLGYRGPGFDLGDGLVLWGFTGGLVDQVLAAAGLEQPWDSSRVEPPPVPGASGPVGPAEDPEAR
ncbi:MAG TPA: CoA pyrophosphatase [Nocardioidaceae bacterium]|nr:CoA pyrophosphatase [Nocardioidaceae bacterium]